LEQLGSAKSPVVSQWKRLDQPSQVCSFADGGSIPWSTLESASTDFNFPFSPACRADPPPCWQHPALL